MSEKGAIARCANSKASYTALSIFRTAFEKAIVVKIWGGQKNLPTQHHQQAKIKYANVFISIVDSLLSVLLKL